MSNNDPLAARDAELDALEANPGAVAAGGFGSPSTSTASSYVTPQRSEWRVYLGSDTAPRIEPGQVDSAEGGRFARQRGTVKVPQVMGTDQANALWYSWSDADRKKWVDYLVERGVLDREDPDLYPKAAQGWADAVQEAGSYFTLSNGKNKVTPWQVVDLYSGGLDGGGPKTSTNTSTSTQHFDDLDARAAAEETYSQLLGRKAKGKEADALQKALNAYAEAHPQVTTQTSTTDAKGNTTSNSTSRGGISAAGAQQIAEEQARSNPSYAEYQASTTVMNWLQQALGATVDL